VPQVASCIPPTRCLLPALLLPRSLCGNSVLSNAPTAVPPTLRADDAPLTPPSTHTQCPFLLLNFSGSCPGCPPSPPEWPPQPDLLLSPQPISRTSRDI
jgi:hypothetical protein